MPLKLGKNEYQGQPWRGYNMRKKQHEDQKDCTGADSKWIGPPESPYPVFATNCFKLFH